MHCLLTDFWEEKPLMASLIWADLQVSLQKRIYENFFCWRQNSFKRGTTPVFQTTAANGHLETPSATAELQFEVRNVLFKGSSNVMTNLKSSLLGLLFLRRNSINLEMRQGLLNFASFSMQLKQADNTHSNINEPLLTPTDFLIQPRKQTVIYNNSQVHTANCRIGHDSTLF